MNFGFAWLIIFLNHIYRCLHMTTFILLVKRECDRTYITVQKIKPVWLTLTIENVCYCFICAWCFVIYFLLLSFSGCRIYCITILLDAEMENNDDQKIKMKWNNNNKTIVVFYFNNFNFVESLTKDLVNFLGVINYPKSFFKINKINYIII